MLRIIYWSLVLFNETGMRSSPSYYINHVINNSIPYLYNEGLEGSTWNLNTNENYEITCYLYSSMLRFNNQFYLQICFNEIKYNDQEYWYINVILNVLSCCFVESVLQILKFYKSIKQCCCEIFYYFYFLKN